MASFWEFHGEVLHLYILSSLELECTARLVLPDSLELHPDALRIQTSDPLQQLHSAPEVPVCARPELAAGDGHRGPAPAVVAPCPDGEEEYTWVGSMCPALPLRELCAQPWRRVH